MINIEKNKLNQLIFETKIATKSNKFIHFKCTHIEKKLLAKKKGSKQLRKNSLKTQKMKIPYFLNFNKRIEKLVKSFYMKPILFFLIILYFGKHIFFRENQRNSLFPIELDIGINLSI